MRHFNYAVLATFLFTLGVGCGGSDEGEITYVAIGASDATGIGASPLSNGYVFRISENLEARTGRDVDLVNLGIPGAEADEIEDIEIRLATELTKAELVTVFVGGNDVVNGIGVEAFEDNFRQILEELRAETDAIIAVGNLPDLTKLPRFTEEPNTNVTAERVTAFNAAISRQTNANGAVQVDLFSEPVETFLVDNDGLHPNDAGHARLAEKFLAVIIPLLPPVR